MHESVSRVPVWLCSVDASGDVVVSLVWSLSRLLYSCIPRSRVSSAETPGQPHPEDCQIH